MKEAQYPVTMFSLSCTLREELDTQRSLGSHFCKHLQQGRMGLGYMEGNNRTSAAGHLSTTARIFMYSFCSSSGVPVNMD